MMGSQGRFGKLVLDEEAFCVPFMIKYPGRLEKSREDLMITPVDIMPTVLGLLGLRDRIPETVEGKNFAPEILTGDWSTRPKPRSALFLGFRNRIKGLRTDRYSFQIDDDGTQVLFDNETDPYQLTERTLSDIPKADADFILSELANWLQTSQDPWYIDRRFADLIPYPA
jgi:arylsulfatase A-like enzyme